MAKYIKTMVVEHEAFQYDGDLKGSNGEYYVPNWAVRAYKNKVLYYYWDGINIPELYIMGPSASVADEKVSVGDYIVQDTMGDIFVLDSKTFEQIYEKYSR